MDVSTPQLREWQGKFGREYTLRNTFSLQQVDELYQRNYSVSRQEMNRRFLGNLSRDIRILEVGCNVGNQLLALQVMGFNNLFGIEIQRDAVDLANERLQGCVIEQGSAFEIPFDDDEFDLVFTSGVLIHISPDDAPKAMAEIYRCSQKLIWGFEYYAEARTEVNYRGNNELLWKADFSSLYTAQFPDLEILKEERFQYTNSENVDAMFLLKKTE